MAPNKKVLKTPGAASDIDPEIAKNKESARKLIEGLQTKIQGVLSPVRREALIDQFADIKLTSNFEDSHATGRLEQLDIDVDAELVDPTLKVLGGNIHWLLKVGLNPAFESSVRCEI